MAGSYQRLAGTGSGQEQPHDRRHPALAEGTVKNYVSIIIDKLRANDRTQAAILALKRGLATLE